MVDSPFQQVVALMPQHLRCALKQLPQEKRERVEEIRLRQGFLPTVLDGDGERDVGDIPVTGELLRQVLEQASQASAHTVLDQVQRGFLTLRGGHRIGICGTAVVRDGKVATLREISSLSVRIARPVVGQAEALLPQLMEGERLQNTLIFAPPGAGKTTLLRDLVRGLSDGVAAPPLRLAVADERGEIAAMWQGAPQLYVGRHTDILDGCGKAAAVSILLRGMNPQVIAMDEITQMEDVEAMVQAVGCGVSLLATAHGERMEDFKRRPVYRRLWQSGVFRRVVLLGGSGTNRTARVEVVA